MKMRKTAPGLYAIETPAGLAEVEQMDGGFILILPDGSEQEQPSLPRAHEAAIAWVERSAG